MARNPVIFFADSDGDVFLGNNYIELGIKSNGAFGTSANDLAGFAEAGFIGRNTGAQAGLTGDADGFNNGDDLRIDYFLPGSPEERWGIAFGPDSYRSYGDGDSNQNTEITSEPVLTVSATDSDAVAEFTIGVDDLLISFTYTLGADAKFYTTDVEITNTSVESVPEVVFMRSFDPDNTVDVGGDYSTHNEVISQYGQDGATASIVAATSAEGDPYSALSGGSTAAISFRSTSEISSVYYGGFDNRNPAEWLPGGSGNREVGSTTFDDIAIGIVFNVGDLGAGESKSFSYDTLLGDQEDLEVFVEDVVAPADNPSIISADTSGDAYEDGPTIEGSISISDVDEDDSPTFPNIDKADSDRGYGFYSLNSETGVWSFTLYNDKDIVNSLLPNQYRYDSFTVCASDGTCQRIEICIKGANDAAVISGDTTGSLNENSTTTSGSISISDPDEKDSPSFPNVDSSPSDKGYGTYSLKDGNWTYNLDSNIPAVEALCIEDTLTDTFSLTASDNTVQTISITINGSTDCAETGKSENCIDLFVGTQEDDHLVGDSCDNTIRGKFGNDILQGALGNDKVIGNGKNDICRGGQGDDVLKGKAGKDLLNGGNQNDLLDGGNGGDILIGGSGADRFRLSKGNDTIKDFSINDGDQIRIDPSIELTGEQVGADLLLTNAEQGISTTVNGVELAQMLEYQPELFA